MGQSINSGQFNIPPPQKLPSTDTVLPNVIIGDEAFALTANMMKPYPRQQSLYDGTKAIYNYRHCRARRTTENSFGIMTFYFRIFLTPIDVSVDKIDKIIFAACILHNMMRSEKIKAPSETTFGQIDNVQMPTANLFILSHTSRRPITIGSQIREMFKEYFNGIGAVNWQQIMV